MAKIYRNQYQPKNINTVFEGKIAEKVVFNDENVFITEDPRTIKALSDYGYEIDKNAKKILETAEEKGFFVPKTKEDKLAEANEELQKKIDELTKVNEKLIKDLEVLQKNDKGND